MNNLQPPLLTFDVSQKKLQGEFYGRLRAKDYGRVLSDFRGLRRGRLEIEELATKKGEKIAALLGEHGYNWWQFYELPYVHHVALFCVLMGWKDDLAKAAKADNPPAAFFDFMDSCDAGSDENNPILLMEPPQQAVALNLVFSLMYSTEALGYFSLTISQLMEQARNGDKRSFLHAVSVDRMVVSTPTGARLIAEAQMMRDKAFLSGIFKSVKSPHSRRKTYVDLRVLHRILEEAGALAAHSKSEVLDLVRSQLGVVAPDTVKGLDDLFRLWKKDAGE